MLPEEVDLLDEDDDDLLDDDDDDDELLLDDVPEDEEVPDDDLVVSAGLLADDDWFVALSAGLVPAPAAAPEVPVVPELPEAEVPEDDLDAAALLMLPDLVLNEPLETLVFGFTLLPGTCLFWNVPDE
ncbi:MAG: hypothetical protein K0Q90_540 [Paenibacillaceae bacterium]|nr:hypothetical protein [Paenibacillaceae bacterium]